MIYVLSESFVGVFYFKTICTMLMDLVLECNCMLNLRECKYIHSGRHTHQIEPYGSLLLRTLEPLTL